MANTNLNPFLMAANVPDPDPRLIPLLESHPHLAAEQDSHGYSLLHAAVSYNHSELLKSLVNQFHVDINLKDEDGETCLFVAETVEVAKCLVEELGVDTKIKNDEGMTAEEKIESEEEYPEIAAYLNEKRTGNANISSSRSTVNGSNHIPPLPAHMRMNITTVPEVTGPDVDEQQPDPEFRRRIEELAAKENFHTAEGQQELRDLITDAVRGVSDEERDAQRRRVG